VRRLCALVLLLLSASPLTAPFSVTDAQDLLGSQSATVQAKKAPDEPLVALGAAPGVAAILQAPLDVITSVLDAGPRARASHVVPLRL
jgi:hypothetical protein